MLCRPSCLFWYLYLAHLLADYPLQTQGMIQVKQWWWGRTLHAGVHLAVLLLIVGPARRVLWPYLLVLAAIHFGLDSLKRGLGEARPRWLSGPYLLDQLAHLLVVLLVAAWIEAAVPAGLLPSGQRWPVVAAGYLLATYVWFVTERLLAHAHDAYRRQVVASTWSRMVIRAVLLTGLLLLLRRLPVPGLAGAWGALTAVGLILGFPYRSARYGWRALAIDLAVPMLVAFVIHWAI